MLAVVSGITAAGIDFLDELLTKNSKIAVRLVVIVHPTCPTREKDLARMLDMVRLFGRELKIFVLPVNEWGECFSWARFDLDEQSLLWCGMTGDFGVREWKAHQGHVICEADPSVAQQFLDWFSSVERHAAPLTDQTTSIPALVPAPGTEDGRLSWLNYLAAFGSEVAQRRCGSRCDKCELIFALVHRKQSLHEIRKALEKKSNEEEAN